MPKLLKDRKPYIIPPCPEKLLKISKLLQAQEPDVDKIAETIKADVSLYSIVMGAANTPLFGGGSRVTSINQAIMRLGLKRIQIITSSDALKATLSRTGRLERFWDTATDVAQIMVKLTAKYSNESTDEAYALGMLHECGIPLMIEICPNFRAFLKKTSHHSILKLCAKEQESYGYHHCTVGAEISNKWLMPTNVSKAVYLQPRINRILTTDCNVNESVKILLCMLWMAKDISNAYRYYWRIDDTETGFQHLHNILQYVGIPDVDYMDIRDDHLDEMNQLA